jgi:hypothetical protein
MSSYEKPRKKVVRFNLITGEETYASQTAQNPITSRRVSSLIPTLAGELERERPRPKYSASVALGAAITWLHQFDKKASDGTFTRHFFVFSNLKLYKDISGTWTEVTAVGNLAGIPQAVNLNNLMHLSDGQNRFIFDGISWVKEGLQIPLVAPELDTAPAGTLNIVTNRFYWTTWVDQGVDSVPVLSSTGNIGGVRTIGNDGLSEVVDAHIGRFIVITTGPLAGERRRIKSNTATLFTYDDEEPDLAFGFGDGFDVVIGSVPERLHESTSSPRSVGTGALTSKKVKVTQQPGTVTTNSANKIVTGTGTGFYPGQEGMRLYVDGTDFGTILTVLSATVLTLTENSPSTESGVDFVIAPQRATHWYVYASEAENSGVGLLLAKKTILTMFHDDESPFAGQSGNLFSPIERPIRNDPAPDSKIMSVHKGRIFRSRPTFPNFFNFTAAEEVESTQAGSPQESVPGADPNTLSDLVNEASFPDESDIIKGMTSHGDALYIGTEDDILPLYGDSIDSFAISTVINFKVGQSGRFGAISTPYGFAFISHDKKAYIYPEQAPPPKEMEATAILVEFGQPQRKKLELIKGSELVDVRTKYYKWGRRNWFVLTYQDTSSVFHTLIYDFDINGWAELSGAIASLATWEVGEGDTVLVGGGTDGNVYILDDLTGTYSITGLNFPEGNFRPALMDFGRPDERNLFRYLEFEVSNENLPIEVRYWFDPVDVDNPGTGIILNMGKLTNSANRFRGFPTQGGFCQRLLVEIKILAGTEAGTIRGIVVKTDPVSNLAI